MIYFYLNMELIRDTNLCGIIDKRGIWTGRCWYDRGASGLLATADGRAEQSNLIFERGIEIYSSIQT